MPKKLFKPGQSGNPDGRPEGTIHTPTQKLLKKLGHREELDQILWESLKGNPLDHKAQIEALEAAIESGIRDDQMTVLEMAVKKFAYEAITEGDIKKLDWIITRLFGKPKETIQHSGNIGNTNHEYGSMDEFLEKNAHMLKRLKDKKE